MTSVNIPNSVTSIGMIAFSNNLLTNIIIPDSITTIEHGVFFYNQLTSVNIPDGVTSIGELAFAGNYLTSITIGANVTFATLLSGNYQTFPAFGYGFEAFYEANGRRAGTYTRPSADSTVWTRN